MPKAAQIERLKEIFETLNYPLASDLIPWNDIVDGTLHLDENIDNLEKRYPEYTWRQAEAENPLVQQLKENIRIARGEGVSNAQIVNALRSAGLDLQRPTSAGLKKALEKIDELEKENKELQERVAGQESQKTTQTIEPKKPTPEELERLYNEYRLAIKARLGKEPSNAEYDQFTSCVEVAPTLAEARSQCQRLIDLLTPKKGLLIPPESPALLTQELGKAMDLPSWAQYLQNRLMQKADEEKRKEERGEAIESNYLLAVLNAKTKKVQNVKFISQEQMDSYIKALPSFYEYTILRGTSRYERTGYGQSKSRK
jgi:hypothetical protein